MDTQRALRGLGKASISLGTLILLFVAFQLWGTGVAERHAQSRLKKEFAAATTVPPPVTVPPAHTHATTTTAAPLPPPPTGAAVAIISIPRIGVDAAVVQGVGVSDLQKGPGHYPNSPMPGQAGNAAIAGHRTTYGAPFYRLDELKAGDDIYVTTKTAAAPWHFQVLRTDTVSPTDVAVLNPTTDAELTLTTCTPRFTASHRLVVVSKLIGKVDPTPVVLPTVPPEASAPSGPDAPAVTGAPLPGVDVGSLSGTSTSTTPAVLWGLLCAAVWAAAWAIGTRTRKWAAYATALPVFLVCLFFFFQNFARFVPANI